MEYGIRGVHCEIGEHEKNMIEKKLHRLEFAEEDIVDLNFIIVKEKNEYKVESNVHFRWGHKFFTHASDFDTDQAIDKLFNKLEYRITKEKDKIKGHK